MRAAVGLTLILVGIAFEWVALHGYESAEPGFKGLLEGLFSGVRRATQE